MDRAYLDEARADRYSDGWSGLVGAVECGGADDPRYSASLEFYRRLGLDIPQGSEEKAFVQMRMESGVSIFWDTVFADKYDPRQGVHPRSGRSS